MQHSARQQVGSCIHACMHGCMDACMQAVTLGLPHLEGASDGDGGGGQRRGAAGLVVCRVARCRAATQCSRRWSMVACCGDITLEAAAVGVGRAGQGKCHTWVGGTTAVPELHKEDAALAVHSLHPSGSGGSSGSKQHQHTRACSKQMDCLAGSASTAAGDAAAAAARTGAGQARPGPATPSTAQHVPAPPASRPPPTPACTGWGCRGSRAPAQTHRWPRSR